MSQKAAEDLIMTNKTQKATTVKCATAMERSPPTISEPEIAGNITNRERPIGKYERLEKGLAPIPEPLGRHADDLFPEEKEIPRSKMFQQIESEDEESEEEKNKEQSTRSYASTASTSCGNSEVDDTEFQESDEEDADNEAWRSVVEIAKIWKAEREKAREGSSRQKLPENWGETASIARSVSERRNDVTKNSDGSKKQRMEQAMGTRSLRWNMLQELGNGTV